MLFNCLREVVAFGLLAAVAPASLQPTLLDERRITRLEQWLNAVFEHEPGAIDRPASFVALWSGRDLETLLVDANALARILRNPNISRFSVEGVDQRPVDVRYTNAQLTRMRNLALMLRCSTATTTPLCLEAARLATEDAGLDRLLTAVRTASHQDGDNNVLKRGALLHTDIDILVPSSDRGADDRPVSSQSVRIQFADGQQQSLNVGPLHLKIARMLLDAVTPDGASPPRPELDDMVRRWYHATAKWFQANEEYEPEHLDRGREIFPDDPTLLLLSGTQHEAWAGPAVQAMIRGAALPTGITIGIRSDRAELRQAEGYFRRALEIDAGMIEARLRLGHVLLMLERYEDAAVELRRVLDSADAPLIRFYASMFLGAADENTGTADAAVESYTHAAELYPTAQSPHVALSALARRRGDRAGAWRAMQRVFALPAEETERDDPWWTYVRQQGRDAELLLHELRTPFQRGAPQ
jgi:tetratricopeptide (TPR) repeat protein